jgi:CRISPR-associated protein Csm1
MEAKMRDVDLIALAGLLHDIGKFGQRADIYKQKSSIYKNKDYKYTHAAYTAQILNDLAFNLGDEMSDNAAMHHNPQNDMQWIIASADRMASGFEREKFEDYNSADSESYKQQRLWHIFDESKQYKIAPLQPGNIFAEEEKSVENEYNALWKAFITNFGQIKERGNSLNDLFTIDYILKKFTSFIPSSTSFQKGNYKAVKANIPLYEHAKTTATFVSALYKLHQQNNDNILNYYKDKTGDLNARDMLLIAGDFFGIQKFIFNAVPTAKASKVLRAKSAYIQILTKIVAFDIVEKLGLSYFSIISTSAGKFEILATNDEATKEKLDEIQKELDAFFVREYFGETGIGISATPCSLGDFIVDGAYKKLREKIANDVERRKYQKFTLNQSDYKIDFDEGINNQNLCTLCQKRKGKERVQNNKSYIACDSCENFVKIGQRLAKKAYLAITKDETDIPLFGGFYLKFTDNPKVFKNSVAVYDISKNDDFKGYAKWELSSYVACDEQGDVLTFEELAELSCKNSQNGVKSLISLKGDVDFMGRFIKDSSVTNSFAKFSFFSRMVDYFFSVYVPYMMQNEYPDTYTVFAGGDDLFVLGAWDEVIALSQKIHDEFSLFCENKMNFSVGMIMTKPNKPVNFIANIAEDALETSKDYKKEQPANQKEKNAITLFGECASWQDYTDMKNDIQTIVEKANKYPDTFGMTFWYRLLEFCDMRENINNDIKNALLRSKVSYMFKRNIIDKHKNENFDDVINTVEANVETYGAAFKMVVFEEIYKRRS